MGRKSLPPAGVVRIRGRSLMAPVAIGSMIRSHEQSCKSARALPSQHEADRELDLLHRRSARGAGLDEPEPGVAHAPSAGLAAGDDGFVAPQLGDGGEDGAPVAVEERGDACSGHNGRLVHGGCGGPVLDVEGAHPGLVVEVVVRQVRVVGRRCDYDEPERGPGGRRGRPAVDAMR